VTATITDTAVATMSSVESPVISRMCSVCAVVVMMVVVAVGREVGT